ncbi:MAG: FAD:protein FMN transferase [Kiritimatiellaeota bacterium]|nr:FAD:protein FMN transferase [Kiritimatiellota bacterium]
MRCFPHRVREYRSPERPFTRLALIASGLLISLAGRAAPAPVVIWEGRTMGTFYTVQLAGVAPGDRRLAELRTAVDRRLDEINRCLSHYLPDSELSRFNAAASTVPVKVSAELARVLRHALELHRRSDGAFDPALGRLINLWGFGPEPRSQQQAPADAEIAAARRQGGARHLRVTPQDELQKDIPGLQLNLGALGKGYGADEIARVLRERGFTNALISVCGETVACGMRAAGQPWQVGVERPRYARDSYGAKIGAVVPLAGGALSTSGDAHNFFRDERGRIYAHILDPATGRPVQHNLASVTVVAANGLIADGLATALYVMGPERGLHWVEQQRDVAALFIVREEADRFRFIASARFPPFRKLE